MDSGHSAIVQPTLPDPWRLRRNILARTFSVSPMCCVRVDENIILFTRFDSNELQIQFSIDGHIISGGHALATTVDGRLSVNLSTFVSSLSNSAKKIANSIKVFKYKRRLSRGHWIVAFLTLVALGLLTGL